MASSPSNDACERSVGLSCSACRLLLGSNTVYRYRCFQVSSLHLLQLGPSLDLSLPTTADHVLLSCTKRKNVFQEIHRGKRDSVGLYKTANLSHCLLASAPCRRIQKAPLRSARVPSRNVSYVCNFDFILLAPSCHEPDPRSCPRVKVTSRP